MSADTQSLRNLSRKAPKAGGLGAVSQLSTSLQLPRF